ncbi:P22 phage major capsid protein family protein [Acinetobacter sp. Marseille-Q1618]|uniref:P22 phage major capsid protein family protein n=1 Tax=Acinetobacter sp. Marseille-Q1618 TaxID=2697502 RepID=UPI00156D82BF|nr:P22 phage major capsid protein family protein [Acinetobacter sp. Marseille-Q1618]
MPNEVLTHQMIAREAAKMLEEEAPFIANINKGRQEEFGKDVQGFKKGDEVTIKIPTAGQVFNGAKFAEGNGASAVIEESVKLKLDTQKHVALQFGAKEKVLDITDFKERILRPQIVTLSSVLEADLIGRGVAGTANQVVMSLTGGNPSNALALARAKLNQYLTPAGDRSALLSSTANVALSNEVSRMYNPTRSSEKAYLQGYVSSAFGADLYEHQSVAVHNNGTAAGLTVAGAAQTGDRLAMAAATAGSLTAGTIFTIAGVNAVHPLTGQDLGVLQQFVVRETVNVGAATAVHISPSLKAVAPAKTVSALAANGAVISVVSVNGFQNLEFHKDAFTTAFAPLPVLASCEGYTARLPSGISVRVMTFGDGDEDYERTRIDVLYGFQVVRPLHACRIIQQ